MTRAAMAVLWPFTLASGRMTLPAATVASMARLAARAEKIAVLPQGGGSGGERIGQIWVHLAQQGHDPVPQQIAGGVVRVGVGGVLHKGMPSSAA